MSKTNLTFGGCGEKLTNETLQSHKCKAWKKLVYDKWVSNPMLLVFLFMGNFLVSHEISWWLLVILWTGVFIAARVIGWLVVKVMKE